MAKNSIRKMTDDLGVDNLASRLRVTTHSIRHARVTGLFPASWFDVIDGMCRERKMDCPRDLFNFKAPVLVPSKRGNGVKGLQGADRKVVSP
jgi:hypothetical protein